MVAGKNIFRRFDTRPDGRLRIARMRQVAIGAALLFLAPGVYARQPIVYPAKGQSNSSRTGTMASVMSGPDSPPASIRPQMRRTSLREIGQSEVEINRQPRL